MNAITAISESRRLRVALTDASSVVALALCVLITGCAPPGGG